MQTLASMAPRRKMLVIDLVREVGIDVSDWSNCSLGEDGASRNPKYCYEWAFRQGELIVLNLWHSDLQVRGSLIVRQGNFRADAERNRQRKQTVVAGRAARIDAILQYASAHGLAVRVVINSARTRDGDTSNGRSSAVQFRELDPECWCLAEYNHSTGAHVLVRGLGAQFSDQFSVVEEPVGLADRRERTGSHFIRDAAVRAAVLHRAAGRCEHCGELGFRTANASIYLETHHVVPLCEDGSDACSNVIALCANHHREAHHGQHRDELRAAFQVYLGRQHRASNADRALTSVRLESA